jgi:hypothetical protein
MQSIADVLVMLRLRVLKDTVKIVSMSPGAAQLLRTSSKCLLQAKHKRKRKYVGLSSLPQFCAVRMLDFDLTGSQHAAAALPFTRTRCCARWVGGRCNWDSSSGMC